MDRNARRLSFVVAGLMAAQAALGRASPGSYRDPDWVTATWIGNDWFTLLVAAPLLTLGLLGRGERAGILVLGVLAYALYNYAFYLFGARLNAFFPLYVLALVLAGAALCMELFRRLSTLPAAPVPSSASHRVVAGYLMLLAAALSAIWLAFWANFAFAGGDTPVEPETFKVVAATDLLLLVPPLAVGGYLLWRRASASLLVAAVAAVQSSLYLLVLTINSFVLIELGLSAAPGELAIWGPLSLITLAAAFRLIVDASNAEGAEG